VPTVRFQVLYVFLLLAHDRRRILHFWCHRMSDRRVDRPATSGCWLGCAFTPSGAIPLVPRELGTGGTLVGLYRGLRRTNAHRRAFLARRIEISESVDQECCNFSRLYREQRTEREANRYGSRFEDDRVARTTVACNDVRGSGRSR
jgi:hypothetical protein